MLGGDPRPRAGDGRCTGGGSPLAWSGVAAALGADAQTSRTPSPWAADMKGPSFALIQGRGFPAAPWERAHHSLISPSPLGAEQQQDSSGLQPGFGAPGLPRGAAVVPSLLTTRVAKPNLNILDHQKNNAGRWWAMTAGQERG